MADHTFIMLVEGRRPQPWMHMLFEPTCACWSSLNSHLDKLA